MSEMAGDDRQTALEEEMRTRAQQVIQEILSQSGDGWYPDIYWPGTVFCRWEVGIRSTVCPCEGNIEHEDDPPSDDTPCTTFWEVLDQEAEVQGFELYKDWEVDDTWYLVARHEEVEDDDE